MATTTLLCKQCNFENEPERVYCHNCGAKLDRSLLPPEATRREDPVIVQERVRKLIRPAGVTVWQRGRNLITSVLVAAVLAFLFLIARTPDGAPTLSSDAVLEAPAITDDMEAAQQQTGAHALRYADNQVNAFLQSSIKGKDKDSFVRFERAYVHFDEGVCRITTQESLFGLSIYATTDRSVAIQNGTVASQSLGGSLGRLKIPGRIMPILEKAFTPLWKVLDHDRQLVAQMQSITFHKGSVEMITNATPIRR